MRHFFRNLFQSLVSRLILAVVSTFLLAISIWAYFSIEYQTTKVTDNMVMVSDKLSNAIMLGTHYAMMLNSREDINQIIKNIGRQPEIVNIRIYNKDGDIKFSNNDLEVDKSTNIKSEACNICHMTTPPRTKIPLQNRIRIFTSTDNVRRLGIISPIYNEPGCSSNCHVHPEDKKILGALDVVMSLEQTDQEIFKIEKSIINFALILSFLTSFVIFIFVLRFVSRPIKKLIEDTRHIAQGKYNFKVDVIKNDEVGQLADAINRMGHKIGEKQAALNRQKDEFRQLFELVPCLITVQDRDYKILRYNKEFSEKFDPDQGDYCYHAYKGRDKKCTDCPIEKTFVDGKQYHAEQSGYNKDGSVSHWFVRSSPIKDSNGDIVAAMEISLDITRRKELEDRLRKSEQRYQEIFNSIPNPVFVIDYDSLLIIDCNQIVKQVYGFSKDQIIDKPFLDLFAEDERDEYSKKIRNTALINQVRHLDKDGKTLVVDIWTALSEFPGQKVLLVITSDVTKRIETEQQLAQAARLATLGEMATGVAHELNQPLSVIKTSSSFTMKKINKSEKINDEILYNLLEKIDSNVDRASKIITNMRLFARKTDVSLEPVRVINIIEKAFDIFSQQLKVRGIEVSMDYADDLPMILADPGRLEQVFINILINARDAIEEKWEGISYNKGEKKISVRVFLENDSLKIEICDTGSGISDEIRDKIFEPFYTTKEVGKGTGLGLSISYGIVKDCGGDIYARTNEQNGTCFILTFPPEEAINGT